MSESDNTDSTKQCKKCGGDADVMLHGRFPFCEKHYLEVVGDDDTSITDS